MTMQTVFAETQPSYLGNTIWYLIVFAALILLVKHYAWGPLSEMMEKRRQKIISDLDSAADNRKKAEVLANEREAALKNSRKEATKILSDAKQNAQTSGQKILDQANSDALAIHDQAKADAEQAKTDAINDARGQVADISVAIAEKVIAKNLSAADQKDLVDQFIKGLNN